MNANTETKTAEATETKAATSKAAETKAAVPATKKPVTRRRKAATSKAKAAPKADKVATSKKAAGPNWHFGTRAHTGAPAPSGSKFLFAPKYEYVWPNVPNGLDCKVHEGSVSPGGKSEKAILAMLVSGDTARKLGERAYEAGVYNVGGIIAHMVNKGVLATSKPASTRRRKAATSKAATSKAATSKAAEAATS